MDSIRIIIADDHPVVRMGLRHILGKEKSFVVIAEAANREELLGALEEHPCDLVITDLKMPEYGDGIGVLKEVRMKHQGMKIVIMSQFFPKHTVVEALRLGADGYLTKDDISDTIVAVLKNIVAGIKALSPRVQSLFLNKGADGFESLTPRELEVLKLIVGGMTRKEIAKELGISIPTVDFHRENIKGKLDADTMAEIVKIAVNNGLF